MPPEKKNEIFEDSYKLSLYDESSKKNVDLMHLAKGLSKNFDNFTSVQTYSRREG